MDMYCIITLRNIEYLMERKKQKIMILFSSVILLTGGCRGKQARQTEEILTIPAVKGNISTAVTFVGNVSSAQSSSLTWGTVGVIENVYVSLGDEVREGQILATLAEDSLSANVLSAETPLLEARDDLDELLLSDVAKAEAYKDVIDKQAALADAEKHRESIRYPRANFTDIDGYRKDLTLAKQYYDESVEKLKVVEGWKFSENEDLQNMYEDAHADMIAKRDTYAEAINNVEYSEWKASVNDEEQAEADIKVAKSEYEKAKKNFNTYAVYPREKDINEAELRIENAQDTYNHRSIVSDINGTVTAQTAREGDYVTRGAAAFQVDNLEHFYIPIDVSEIDVTKISDGERAEVALDAVPGKMYNGIVSTISASGSEDSNRVIFPTMIEITDPDEKVKVGMTGEVDIIREEKTNTLLVPSNALVTVDGITTVTVIRDGVEIPKEVTVGILNENVAEIITGDIKEGENIRVPSIDNSILAAMGLPEEPFGPNPPEFPDGNEPMEGIPSGEFPEKPAQPEESSEQKGQ